MYFCNMDCGSAKVSVTASYGITPRYREKHGSLQVPDVYITAPDGKGLQYGDGRVNTLDSGFYPS